MMNKHPRIHAYGIIANFSPGPDDQDIIEPEANQKVFGIVGIFCGIVEKKVLVLSKNVLVSS